MPHPPGIWSFHDPEAAEELGVRAFGDGDGLEIGLSAGRSAKDHGGGGGRGDVERRPTGEVAAVFKALGGDETRLEVAAPIEIQRAREATP